MEKDAAQLAFRLSEVSVTYGSFRALHHVSAEVPRDAIGLVGRNGAGKSTLLKLLLGLVSPSSGSGEVLGVPLATAGDRLRRLVGYMPESDSLIPGLYGVEQTILAGELCGLSKREAIRRAHEVLMYVGLGEARYREVQQYSTGMRQRLKLAVALVHDPELLLLDEPTVGLDPPGRMRMLDLIGDLARSHGKSLIICTHLLDDIETTCNRVLVIDQGRIVRHGTLAEILEGGKNRFRLEWVGEAAKYRESLARAGIAVHPLADHAEKGDQGESRAGHGAIIDLPDHFDTRRLFQLAADADISLRLVERQREDLSELYHRMLMASGVGGGAVA